MPLIPLKIIRKEAIPTIKPIKILGTLKKDCEIEIVEIKENWGKISQNKWINLKYCKKI